MKTAVFLVLVATGYCPGPCCSDGDGVTATGRDARTKGVAVDPRVIPLGSRLDVPDYGAWVPADDVGGAIKGNRIDIRFASHSEAKAFGRRKVRVRVWTTR